jgi:hypothetical protein
MKRINYKFCIFIISVLIVCTWSASVADEAAKALWNAASGQARTNSPASGTIVQQAAFSPDGRLVLLTGSSGTFRIWDAGTGGAIARLHKWTFRLRGRTYGIAEIGPVGTQQRATYLIWNSTAHSVPPALLVALGVALLGALIAAVRYWCVKRET